MKVLGRPPHETGGATENPEVSGAEQRRAVKRMRSGAEHLYQVRGDAQRLFTAGLIFSVNTLDGVKAGLSVEAQAAWEVVRAALITDDAPESEDE